MIEIPPLPPPPPLQIPDLEDLEAVRDRILEGLTKGRGSFARTSPQYKAAAKALDRFIEATMQEGIEPNE